MACLRKGYFFFLRKGFFSADYHGLTRMACLRKGFFSRRFTQIERRADWRGLACLRKSIFFAAANYHGWACLRKGFFSRRFTQIERRADWLACARFIFFHGLSRINTDGLRKSFRRIITDGLLAQGFFFRRGELSRIVLLAQGLFFSTDYHGLTRMACLRKGFFSRRFTQIERRADWRGLACLRKSIFFAAAIITDGLACARVFFLADLRRLSVALIGEDWLACARVFFSPRRIITDGLACARVFFLADLRRLSVALIGLLAQGLLD
jgi:hypothetical protein